MTHRQRSYAKVGDITRAQTEFQEGEQNDVRRFGDLTEECQDAETVLRNWIEIARFNIGTSALLAIMDRAREEQSR
ncbi:hypothetical protein [Pontitalea aquivivens]|uniref:hypothetical protein n=1 Tax=Pontitalea aquivivens TaxID=3388663 RepID=UPI00397090B8